MPIRGEKHSSRSWRCSAHMEHTIWTCISTCDIIMYKYLKYEDSDISISTTTLYMNVRKTMRGPRERTHASLGFSRKRRSHSWRSIIRAIRQLIYFLRYMISINANIYSVILQRWRPPAATFACLPARIHIEGRRHADVYLNNHSEEWNVSCKYSQVISCGG